MNTIMPEHDCHRDPSGQDACEICDVRELSLAELIKEYNKRLEVLAGVARRLRRETDILLEKVNAVAKANNN